MRPPTKLHDDQVVADEPPPDAWCLFRLLLDRHAKLRRPQVLVEPFATSAEGGAGEEDLAVLAAAAEARAILVDEGRVTLRDARALSEFLGSPFHADRVEASVRALQDRVAALPEARARACLLELSSLVNAWRSGATHRRLEFSRLQESWEFLLAWSATVTRAPDDTRDLRSFSRQECGDSKLMERHLGRLVSAARRARRLPEEIEDREVCRILGLEKFPHTVSVSGLVPAFAFAGSRQRHLGLHPDLVGELPLRPFATLLTIENYASFNRHVREAMGEDEVVVWTAGWPSPSVAAVIRHLAPLAGRCLHWGDIDVAGAGIADAVWRIAGRDLGLHLMTPEIALARGTPHRGRALSVDPASPARPLMDWLTSRDACIMEQEELDPVPVLDGIAEESAA
ncbi:DUF2220 domain-containing protein [Cereibacter sphaeroides]|uniref:Wadjet anti-phage system protein JetD domain-containing protein n=1 Tax=Cereibacter sphaeroides TaxID=1063 RepID=UPI001F282899|nr:Wadjet anti-phage system protein JetD domain-containing protein [Cereibacter sphaeroides]MCE6959256.1 DUF2220 domain-containing protein [Cereibacter sphaeroides]MCE6971250.1 DUF2220 domain-containing protein [Cereibacter sphaeroides]